MLAKIELSPLNWQRFAYWGWQSLKGAEACVKFQHVLANSVIILPQFPYRVLPLQNYYVGRPFWCTFMTLKVVCLATTGRPAYSTKLGLSSSLFEIIGFRGPYRNINALIKKASQMVLATSDIPSKFCSDSRKNLSDGKKTTTCNSNNPAICNFDIRQRHSETVQHDSWFLWFMFKLKPLESLEAKIVDLQLKMISLMAVTLEF